MKIVLAPDKFKGSLSAAQAVAALRRGFQTAWPEAQLFDYPIADGGEGTARTLCEALGGEWIVRTVRGPMGQAVEAGYAWLPERDGLAILEMSEASGLALVGEESRNPLQANTFGTGELLADAIGRGAQRVVIGIGGSATNDGGAGLATALGYRFETEAGVLEQPVPARFHEITRIDASGVPALPEVIAACDVLNPLLGPRGASRLFGPQKGASPEGVETLEAALSHLAERCAEALGRDHRETPGAGAAGGLGFGLLSFCRAEVQPGFELVASILGLEEAVAQADLVITGEGSLDSQTLEGKGPAGVAALARRHGKPVIAFGGRIAREELRLLDHFDAIVPLADGPMSLPQAVNDAAVLLERAALHAARLCHLGRSLL